MVLHGRDGHAIDLGLVDRRGGHAGDGGAVQMPPSMTLVVIVPLMMFGAANVVGKPTNAEKICVVVVVLVTRMLLSTNGSGLYLSRSTVTSARPSQDPGLLIDVAKLIAIRRRKEPIDGRGPRPRALSALGGDGKRRQLVGAEQPRVDAGRDDQQQRSAQRRRRTKRAHGQGCDHLRPPSRSPMPSKKCGAGSPLLKDLTAASLRPAGPARECQKFRPCNEVQRGAAQLETAIARVIKEGKVMGGKNTTRVAREWRFPC